MLHLVDMLVMDPNILRDTILVSLTPTLTLTPTITIETYSFSFYCIVDTCRTVVSIFS
jgi:hypothetical protein